MGGLMFFRRLRCSFCGKDESKVAKLVAGPRVYICFAGARVADVDTRSGDQLRDLRFVFPAERATQPSEEHQASHRVIVRWGDRRSNRAIVDRRSSHHPIADYRVLLTRAAATTFSGSGVKSSPGLMKRSFSKRYCLSYS